MEKVILIEKKKRGKTTRREEELDRKVAETYLRKSNSWEIKTGQSFVFKDGALVTKANHQDNK